MNDAENLVPQPADAQRIIQEQHELFRDMFSKVKYDAFDGQDLKKYNVTDFLENLMLFGEGLPDNVMAKLMVFKTKGQPREILRKLYLERLAALTFDECKQALERLYAFENPKRDSERLVF